MPTMNGSSAYGTPPAHMHAVSNAPLSQYALTVMTVRRNFLAARTSTVRLRSSPAASSRSWNFGLRNNRRNGLHSHCAAVPSQRANHSLRRAQTQAPIEMIEATTARAARPISSAVALPVAPLIARIVNAMPGIEIMQTFDQMLTATVPRVKSSTLTFHECRTAKRAAVPDGPGITFEIAVDDCWAMNALDTPMPVSGVRIAIALNVISANPQPRPNAISTGPRPWIASL